MTEAFTSMHDLVGAFARAMNLIDSEVQAHHEKVTYLAYHLAEACGLNEAEKHLAYYGALLHDVGTIAQAEDLSLLELEAHPGRLAQASVGILRLAQPTAVFADVVAQCQSPWHVLRQLPERLRAPRLISQIIHLADVVSLLLREDGNVLNQVERIRECIDSMGQAEFSPEVLEAFDEVSHREIIWMDMLYHPQLYLDLLPDNKGVSLEDTLFLTEFMSRVIDFRSPFTAMHSAGVATAAQCLARYVGMSERECTMMRIAGNLHDVGKLRIPTSILEKPGKLTDSEFNIMKEHVYYTHILLKDITGFEQISLWASLHHEKLNGSGYPFHKDADELPLGSRIMAVADVFSAITEERPYRKGMEPERALQVLRGDADRGALSPDLVELLASHYDEINEKRDTASREASQRYQQSLAQQD